MDFMPLIFVFGVISDRGLSWEEKEYVLKIYKDYRLYIRKTVSQRIQDQHDVEDVIQDCYLQLTKYIDRLIQLDTLQLTRYVFRVIDSCCNNYWLKKKVMVEYSDALLNQPIEEIESASFAGVDDDRYEAFCKAMDALPFEEQQLLRLRYEDDLSSKEVAAMFGTTDTNVNTMVCRIKKKIRKQVKQILAEESSENKTDDLD